MGYLEIEWISFLFSILHEEYFFVSQLRLKLRAQQRLERVMLGVIDF
jgi:hypothetical protein